MSGMKEHERRVGKRTCCCDGEDPREEEDDKVRCDGSDNSANASKEGAELLKE